VVENASKKWLEDNKEKKELEVGEEFKSLVDDIMASSASHIKRIDSNSQRHKVKAAEWLEKELADLKEDGNPDDSTLELFLKG